MPIVALVGRPNVGKSTLFNRLIGEHRAVVHDVPGTTRDRQYGQCEWRAREFTVVDTGGIGLDTGEGLLADVRMQAQEAISEADVIVFVLDAASGITASDEDVADLLRRTDKPTLVAANKAENQRRQMDATEFYALGMGEPITVSALHGEGTGDLLDAIVEWFPKTREAEDDNVAVSIAIVGRPNVGKSSLLNALVGSERSIVRDEAGTTRDAIDTVIRYHEQSIRLIDTAGIRRRGRVAPGVEKFSVLRAVRAMERADVAVLVIDGAEGVLAQDTHVASFADEAAKGMVVAVNKWDLVEKEPHIQEEYTAHVRASLKFAGWAPIVFISALTRQRINKIIELGLEVKAERTKRVPTSKLNEVIRGAVQAHPLNDRGKSLKIYYTAQTGHEPPRFTCFCNDPKLVHFSYVRYLENNLREAFQFKGTPIRIEFRGRDGAPAAN
ncbi:MAG: ribosome biogenesis GTPase Der [Chloroflexi bacterium]|nr:ribosome biogenesis GTPase Der [Chloroflexota bacterium]